MVRARRVSWIAVVAGALALTFTGCSWKRLDETASSASAEMRSVPTVPSAAGDIAADDDSSGGDGGDGSAGAVSPPSAPPLDDIGDPPPDPDNPPQLPPLPDANTADACTRLTDVAAADVVAADVAEVAGPVTTDLVDDDVCRLSAGATVVEVHYLPEGDIVDDWFQRAGIDTVGELGPDAVGLVGSLPPGGNAGPGFTIAMVSRRQGAVITVTGSPDDRTLAVDVALAVTATT